MTVCAFCQQECDGTLILRDQQISMRDGSDMTLCSTCLNLYANEDYDELNKRIEKIKCLMWKKGKCNSDYDKNRNCDGVNPPEECPYKTKTEK